MATALLNTYLGNSVRRGCQSSRSQVQQSLQLIPTRDEKSPLVGAHFGTGAAGLSTKQLEAGSRDSSRAGPMRASNRPLQVSRASFSARSAVKADSMARKSLDFAPVAVPELTEGGPAAHPITS